MQTNPRSRVPSVWYDLSMHVGAALDTVSVVREICPNFSGMSDCDIKAITRMLGLVSAVETILEIANQEVDALEMALMEENNQAVDD